MLDYKEVPNIQVVTLAPKQLCVAIAIKLLEVRGEYRRNWRNYGNDKRTRPRFNSYP